MVIDYLEECAYLQLAIKEHLSLFRTGFYSVLYKSFSDNGKPRVIGGRKATGLMNF